jgi:hypothetical protein
MRSDPQQPTTIAPNDPPYPAARVEEPDEPSNLDELEMPQGDDDSRWDVFIPDPDERDPLPDPGDFWHDEFPNDE